MYVADGELRLPNRSGNTPFETGMDLSGSVNPLSGSWQVAHDWPSGCDRLTSKNSFLPSCCLGVSTGPFAIDEQVNVTKRIAATLTVASFMLLAPMSAAFENDIL